MNTDHTDRIKRSNHIGEVWVFTDVHCYDRTFASVVFQFEGIRFQNLGSAPLHNKHQTLLFLEQYIPVATVHSEQDLDQEIQFIAVT